VVPWPLHKGVATWPAQRSPRPASRASELPAPWTCTRAGWTSGPGCPRGVAGTTSFMVNMAAGSRSLRCRVGKNELSGRQSQRPPPMMSQCRSRAKRSSSWSG
jgi:hypothetical protein